MAIRKLTPAVHEKIWGSQETAPWFANPEGRRIGEIWFAAPEMPSVLVKFLFTSDLLSVQVHPDDAYAQLKGGVRGKTEMWHVLRAEPESSVAIGLREEVSKERLHAAALSGEITKLLTWLPAQAGATFFVPAGTVHAVGKGLVVCEIQQFSDITYRLYDYQRKPERPLHLEDSLAIAITAPVHVGVTPARGADGWELLVESPYFTTERLQVAGTAGCAASPTPRILVAVEGEGSIEGQSFGPGEAWLVPGDSEAVSLESKEAVFLRVSVP